MSSRRYRKRVWRVPKNRGPAEYLATLVVKLLVKHGWPAKFELLPHGRGFQIIHDRLGVDHPPDFDDAIGIAVRITARTYRVEVSEVHGAVTFDRAYRVGAGGHFIKDNEP